MSVSVRTATIQPRRAVLEMPEYRPPLAGRDALQVAQFTPAVLLRQRDGVATQSGQITHDFERI